MKSSEFSANYSKWSKDQALLEKQFGNRMEYYGFLRDNWAKSLRSVSEIRVPDIETCLISM